MPHSVVIRGFSESDAPVLVSLITELATYERMTHKLTATPEKLVRWMLGPRPVAEGLIAELDGKPAGYAVFFLKFSTFKAEPKLYLEDIFVKPELRGLGVGESLMRHVANIALQRGCTVMEWSVLNWNEPAIGFYRRLGATPGEPEWTQYGVSGATLAQLAGARVNST
jgi:GNAT superfamily N-acetyltransferase